MNTKIIISIALIVLLMLSTFAVSCNNKINEDTTGSQSPEVTPIETPVETPIETPTETPAESISESESESMSEETPQATPENTEPEETPYQTNAPIILPPFEFGQK